MTTIADLAADAPLSYAALHAAYKAGTLAQTLAALTPAQRVACAAVVAEVRKCSISHALAVFGKIMDAAGLVMGAQAEQPALNCLGEPMPQSEAESLARQLVRELAEMEQLGIVGEQLVRYEAKSAQVRALGYDIGPDAQGQLCLYDAATQRPLNPTCPTCGSGSSPCADCNPIIADWDALSEQSRRDRETTQAGLRAFASLPARVTISVELLARAVVALRLLAPEAATRDLEREAHLVADALVKVGQPAPAGEWGVRTRAA